jgi:ATP-binding cassette subfamily G (WHITE) protein 2 (PDR)
LQYLSPNPRETSRLLHQEILLGDSVLQCWDNSTRGLDSVNALDFIKTLRKRTSESGSVAIVTLYQAGEDIYKVRKVPVEDTCRCLYTQLFDKVTVLHEGRQIYFGPTQHAKKYFTDLGFFPPERSTTPEFLTSISRSPELRPRARSTGWVPRNATDFAKAWKTSAQRQALINEIDAYNHTYPLQNPESLRAMRLNLKESEEKQ